MLISASCVLVSTKPTTGDASQLSVAVTLAGKGTALHATVIFTGTATNTGAVISLTIIVCVCV